MLRLRGRFAAVAALIGLIGSLIATVPGSALAASSPPQHTVGLPVPTTTPHLSAVNPEAGVLYEAGYPAPVIDVISETSLEQVGSIPIPDIAGAMTFDQTTNLLYVADLYGQTVWVINAVTGAIVNSIGGLPIPQSAGLWVNEVTNTLYTANATSFNEPAQITALDAGTGTILASFETQYPLNSAVVDPVRNTLVLSTTYDSFSGGQIDVLNGRTLATEASHFFGGYVQRFGPIAINSITDTIYVTFDTYDSLKKTGSGGLYAIDASSLSITNTIENDNAINDIFVDVSRGYIYALTGNTTELPDQDNGVVTVYSLATGAQLEQLTVGIQADYAVLDTTTGQLTVDNENSGSPSLNVITSPAEQNVFRFNRGAINDHFYTMDVVEAEGIERLYPGTWTYEGVAFQAFGTQVPGTEPLFRFWSNTLQGHFFTADQSERDEIINKYPTNVWDYEGVDFYVYPDDSTVGDTTEIARFWSPTYGQHFYTEDPVETAGIRANDPPSIWTFEGYNFRVPSN